MDIAERVTENKRELRKIIKRYLSTVVYIDDKFDLSLIDTTEEPVTRPSRKGRHHTSIPVTEEGGDESTIEKPPQNDLIGMLGKLQQSYPEVRLQPIVYENKGDIPYIRNSIESAKLILIDWNLHEGETERYTAVDIVRDAFEKEDHMHLFVVYTSNRREAWDDFVEKQVIRDQHNVEDAFDYTILSNGIIMICDKHNFSLNRIIDSLTDIIVEHYGYFPVTFFSAVTKLDERMGKLLKRFSKPFDSLLLMQLDSTGVEYPDISDMVKNMVSNCLKDELTCDDSIVDSLYQNKIESIKACAVDEATMKTSWETAIALMRLNADPAINKWLDHARTINIAQLREKIERMSPEPDRWNMSFKSIRRFVTDHIKEEIVEEECEKIISGIPEREDIKKSLKETIKDNPIQLCTTLKNEISKETEDLLSLLLMNLNRETPIIGSPVCDLITNLKLRNYDNSDLSFIQQAGSIRDKMLKLKNKLFSGDILYKKIDDKPEFLLCIVPSCQLFRPYKVDFKIQYVKGVVSDKEYPSSLRDSEHVTILPCPDTEGKLVCVKWQFHDIKVFDLKEADHPDIEELLTYQRPYRLAEDYFRQVMSRFNSFYGKVGVEDLFIKQSERYANFFLATVPNEDESQIEEQAEITAV